METNSGEKIIGVTKSGNLWKASIQVDGKHYNKSFSIITYGDDIAKEEAIKQRKAWEEEFKEKIQAAKERSSTNNFFPKRQQFKKENERSRYIEPTTLEEVKGVYHGYGNGTEYWEAQMTVNNKVIKEKFNVKQYGYYVARHMAIEQRKEWENSRKCLEKVI